jgi:hypothetical protein
MRTSRHPVEFLYTRQELGRLELQALGYVKHGIVPSGV